MKLSLLYLLMLSIALSAQYGRWLIASTDSARSDLAS